MLLLLISANAVSTLPPSVSCYLSFSSFGVGGHNVFFFPGRLLLWNICRKCWGSLTTATLKINNNIELISGKLVTHFCLKSGIHIQYVLSTVLTEIYTDFGFTLSAVKTLSNFPCYVRNSRFVLSKCMYSSSRLNWIYRLVEMSWAAVPMATLTVKRNGKRPCRNTKTGEKQGNENPRQGNGLTRTTYQWSDPHCIVYHSSLWKRVRIRKWDVLMLSITFAR